MLKRTGSSGKQRSNFFRQHCIEQALLRPGFVKQAKETLKLKLDVLACIACVEKPMAGACWKLLAKRSFKSAFKIEAILGSICKPREEICRNSFRYNK
ncbi:hypothetical protein OIU74_024624 [Salix koriyanagi]|uniref:Uncharacterized protein n=1 Tax=Salix koriyanagi TaxID=2511006 RepID=A0A9Q0W792_9ROSI|nr:hypothetical protein OIU74_024624 [Salix koriyanagi]